MKNQVEQEVEQEGEGDAFEKLDQLLCIMEKKLTADEFELFKKLRNEEVDIWNEFENNFYTGEGCLDYVWVESNGKKYYSF